MKKPVHPALVHFPIALLPASFVADAVHAVTGWRGLLGVGWWMMLAASVTGAFTVAAGLFDMHRTPLADEVHERVHRHMRIGLCLAAVMVALTLWRWTSFERNEPPPLVYLDASFLATLLAAFQGWLGGELVYRHGVFVAAKDHDGPATAGSQQHHST